MRDLVEQIKSLKNTKVRDLIEKRIKEFEEIGNKESEEIFKELCFCLLTANFSAKRSIRIQEKLGGDFLTLSEKKLAQNLRELGHRFPNTRAKYILEARKYSKNLKEVLNSFKSEKELREFFVKNIKGLGYKESSHFLRNIGFKNLMIIDFHILDLMEKYGLIEKPKTLNKKKYLEIECLLEKIAKEVDLNLAQLDLYLWYMETGMILK